MTKLYKEDVTTQELLYEESVNTLKEGLDNGEFNVVYQPQLNSKEKTLYGVEALVRWKRKGIGFISPTEFIPFAEDTGLIHELGCYVLEEAISTATLWKSKGYQFKKISVNVSPVGFENPNYIENLISICSRYNFPHELLELEITEGIDFSTVHNGVETVNEITRNGFKVAIDDFGAGYSNLFSLVTLDLNTIKVDKVVADSIDNPRTQFILSSIIKFGKEYDMNVLVEGVETEEQKNIIKELGCYLVQGYYYSKPKSKDEIDIILQQTS